MRDTYAGIRGRVRVKTCAKKRTEVGTTARSGVRGECRLRGPHGVVKSIRPGLQSRLPALLTVVRRERHQRDWEDLEDVAEGERGGRGQRATNKISSTVCPLWEHGIPFHPFSVFFVHSRLEALSSPRISPTRLRVWSPTHVQTGVHGCHSNFQFWSLWRGNRVACAGSYAAKLSKVRQRWHAAISKVFKILRVAIKKVENCVAFWGGPKWNRFGRKRSKAMI